MINRQNESHIEYCKHIDIDFWFLPESEDEELITVQHHTSVLGSTQELLSLRAPTLDEEIPPEEVTSEELLLTEITTDAITLAAIVESPAGPKDSIVSTFSNLARRRRSLNACEDACYEVSLEHFEISFDLEASNFKIKNDDKLIFNKNVNFSEILTDQEMEIHFEAYDNFFADVPKIRYENFPRQYSSLPKRKNG